jgi:hypothetical protein
VIGRDDAAWALSGLSAGESSGSAREYRCAVGIGLPAEVGCQSLPVLLETADHLAQVAIDGGDHAMARTSSLVNASLSSCEWSPQSDGRPLADSPEANSAAAAAAGQLQIAAWPRFVFAGACVR